MDTNTVDTRTLRLPICAGETACERCEHLRHGTEAASCLLFREIVSKTVDGRAVRLEKCRTVEETGIADLDYWRREAGRLQTIVGAVCELVRSGEESTVLAVRRVVLANADLRNELTELRAARVHTVYFVDCSTGCSCCQGEDHERGPFSSREIAEERIARYRSLPLLASQYAKRGSYRICEREAEVLPDGRLIVDHHVYQKIVDEATPGGDEEKCAT